ncbi:cytochrome c biogenesis protein CcdA [Myxococcota bacterium]|nr:cytochrome c biogenesis protein CcdA [Myxococcota bacterium]
MGEVGSHALLAFAAGMLSVFSPCVLPLMPAYLSLISGISVEEMRSGSMARTARGRVMLGCFGFVAGFSLVFVVMGVGAVAIGRVIRTWRLDLFGLELGVSQIAGLAIVVLGLHMMGVTPLRWLYRDTRPEVGGGRRGFWSTFAVGAGFALGWSPCIGPILATVLTVAGSRETMGQGVVLLLIYSAGLAIPFLLAGWSIEIFFEGFSRIKQHFRKLEIASGGLIVAVGLLLVTNQFTRLNSQFKFMTDWLAAAEKAIQ